MKKQLFTLGVCLLFFICSACGTGSDHTGQVQPPNSSDSLQGKNYKDVITQFETAGFTNIQSEKIEDLVIGFLKEDGEVERVSINGDDEYSTSKWYPVDAKVVVAYHTFPGKTDATEETNNTDNTKPDSSDFDEKTSITVEIGDYSVDIPEKWIGEYPYYYPEQNDDGSVNKSSLLYFSWDKDHTFSEEEVIDEKNREEFIGGVQKSFENPKITKTDLFEINGKKVCYFAMTGSLQSIDGELKMYWFHNPSDNGIAALMFFQSSDSKYNYSNDIESIINSLRLTNSSVIDEGNQIDQGNLETTNETVSPEPTSTTEPISQPTPTPKTTVTPKPESSSVSYSTNSKDTVKNGNSGVYAYKSKGGSYDIYYIVDFDEGYVYYFLDGNGDSTCDRVKIDSGDLNSVVVITYHDGGSTWQYGLHFKWKNQPEHLVVEDGNGFENDYYSTNLSSALSVRNKKTITDY